MEIGRDTSYIRKCRKSGKINKGSLKSLCILYGLDYEKITSKEVQEQRTDNSNEITERIAELEKKVMAVLEAINVISDAIKEGSVEVHTNVDELSDLENAVLLLDKMTKYGSCQEDIYRRKAKEYHMKEKSVTQAIQSSGLTRKVLNGKMWLER